MTSGGNNFNDLPEIVPTREITTRTEKNFLFLVHGCVSTLFPEWAQSCSINSTHPDPACSQLTENLTNSGNAATA